MIRSACKTFPATTGLGADIIHPRALLRLSDTALDALANIMNAAERNGACPDFLQLVMTVLLPESDGVRRPIGLFPTLHRVWMRTRRPCIKQWRKNHSRTYRYGGAGRLKEQLGSMRHGRNWRSKEAVDMQQYSLISSRHPK